MLGISDNLNKRVNIDYRSDSSDDNCDFEMVNIDEVLEETLGGTIDKNMTLKDARNLWATLRTRTAAWEALQQGHKGKHELIVIVSKTM